MRRSAQALVEFALAVSVFLLLVLGTFDLARAYLAYIVVADVAREASRYGAAHSSDPLYAPAAAVQAGKNLAVGLDASALSLTVDPPIVGTLSFIRAHGGYQFQSITPGVAALFGDPITHTISLTVDTSTLIG